jgi:uncharacterized protein
MPLYVLIGRDGPEGAARRPGLRPAHLAHWRSPVLRGSVRFAGPLRGPAGAPVGSLIVFEAPDAPAAAARAAADPYVAGGVFATHEVFETLQVLPEGAA